MLLGISKVERAAHQGFATRSSSGLLELRNKNTTVLRYVSAAFAPAEPETYRSLQEVESDVSLHFPSWTVWPRAAELWWSTRRGSNQVNRKNYTQKHRALMALSLC